MSWKGLVPFVDLFLDEEAEEDVETIATPILEEQDLYVDKTEPSFHFPEELAAQLQWINLSVCTHLFLFILAALFAYFALAKICRNGKAHFVWLSDVINYAFEGEKRAVEMEEELDQWGENRVTQITKWKNEMNEEFFRIRLEIMENQQQFLLSYNQQVESVKLLIGKIEQASIMKLERKEFIPPTPGGDSDQF